MDINQEHKPRYLHTQHFYITLNNILGAKNETIIFSFPLSEGQRLNIPSPEIPLRQYHGAEPS